MNSRTDGPATFDRVLVGAGACAAFRCGAQGANVEEASVGSSHGLLPASAASSRGPLTKIAHRGQGDLGQRRYWQSAQGMNNSASGNSLQRGLLHPTQIYDNQAPYVVTGVRQGGLVVRNDSGARLAS
jgi:hypothetical protein